MPAEVEDIDEEAALFRAADLIGQLGDPHYIRKSNALYLRVRRVWTEPPARLRKPGRSRQQVSAILLEQRSPYIVQTAIRHLQVTASGRQWVANLHSNIFRAERDIGMVGPQK